MFFGYWYIIPENKIKEFDSSDETDESFDNFEQYKIDGYPGHYRVCIDKKC